MSSSSTEFRRGDLVEVQPWAEIRATLDENGMCEGLAFMPEMLKYCGGCFVISKWIARNHKCPLCGTREVHDVVLLRGVYCRPTASTSVDVDMKGDVDSDLRDRSAGRGTGL